MTEGDVQQAWLCPGQVAVTSRRRVGLPTVHRKPPGSRSSSQKKPVTLRGKDRDSTPGQGPAEEAGEPGDTVGG